LSKVDGFCCIVFGSEDWADLVLDGEEMDAAPTTPSREGAQNTMKGGNFKEFKALD
jgi:hypothetical protein